MRSGDCSTFERNSSYRMVDHLASSSADEGQRNELHRMINSCEAVRDEAKAFEVRSHRGPQDACCNAFILDGVLRGICNVRSSIWPA